MLSVPVTGKNMEHTENSAMCLCLAWIGNDVTVFEYIQRHLVRHCT